MANIRMFTDILRQQELPEEKRAEFLSTLAAQVHKLDFLMQSLIKMSRLETGTFALHMENASLYDTIAQAVGGILAAADRKHIRIDVDCDSRETLWHDPSGRRRPWETSWTTRSNTHRRGDASMSASAPGSSTPGSISRTPGSGFPPSTTTTYSSAFTGRSPLPPQRVWGWDCIWPGGSSPGKGAISP